MTAPCGCKHADHCRHDDGPRYQLRRDDDEDAPALDGDDLADAIRCAQDAGVGVYVWDLWTCDRVYP